MSTNLNAALDFLKRWPQAHLFPAYWNTKTEKHNTHVSWGSYASNDPEQIKRWAIQYPGWYFCVDLRPAGNSGLSVIDVDTKNGKDGRVTLFDHALAGRELPPTLEVSTPSNGTHLFFVGAVKNGVGKKEGYKLGEGIDTPGMVPVPGSIAHGKGSYKIVADLPIPPQQEWVRQMAGPIIQKDTDYDLPLCDLDQPEDIDRAIKFLENEAPESIQGEGGDDTLLKEVAYRLKDLGISREKMVELLLDHWNDTKAHPPWAPRDLEEKAANAYKYSYNRPGCCSLSAIFPCQPTNDAYRCATDIVRANIKPRQWLLYGRYAKSFVTVTASPGGVGKSSLALLECFALSTGIQYTYHQVRETGASWYYNTEDDYDELERRIEAIKIHHNVRNTDFKHRFFFSSGRTKPLKLVADDKKLGLVINEVGIKWLIDTITEQQTKLFILDPFVRAHSVSEQGIDLDVVVQQLQRVADATGCAISILHHTTKGKANGYGDADKVRGSGSLVASARIVHMLAPMEEKDARQYGLNAGDNSWYCRMDIAKGNLTAPSHDVMWFKKVSVQVIDGDKDTIGAIERATLSRVVPTDPVEMIKDLVSKNMNSGEEKSFYTLAVAIAAMELTGLKRNSLEVRLKDIYASPVFYEGRDFRPAMVRGGRGKETAGLRCDEAP